MVFGSSNSKFKLRSGHAKSTTNLAGPTTYLRRSNTMESMEGSYKRTPDPCAALATTMPVFPPTIATATKTSVNSVAVGVATQATKLLSKTSKLFDVIEKSYPRDLKAKSPPPVNAVKPYVDLNCVATKLAAFEIKEACVTSKLASQQHQDAVKQVSNVSKYQDAINQVANVSKHQDASSRLITQVSKHEDLCPKVSDIEQISNIPKHEDMTFKVLDMNQMSNVPKHEDMTFKVLDIEQVSNIPKYGDVSPKVLDINPMSNVPKHEDVTFKVLDTSHFEIPKKEEKKPTRTSVASQASESTPILRLESPSSSDSDDCALPASPKPPASTSDAASQTEQEQNVASPPPLSPIREPEAAAAPLEIQPSPSPTLSQSRVALREEEECQQLSRDLVSQLSPSDRLLTILAPEPKKVTDYVSGLFRLDIRTQRPSSRLALSPQPPDSPPASPSNVTPALETSTSSSNASVAPLPADSAYFTTSESKARFLTQYCEDISAPSISASEDLQRKKEELVTRLGRKLAVLREEQFVLSEETELNESLGAALQERLRGADRPTEAAKLAHHVEEVGKVTSLLLSLSGRLARAENAIMGLALCDEKRILEGKRDKLAEQLAEATQLKSSIDRRSASVSALLNKALDAEAAADFEHFVHMKASLQVESRELADRVRLGEEQLAALRETLHS